MKTVSANLLNHLGGTVLNVAKCIKITLQRHQPEIVDITQANPGVVTSKWAHGFKTGDVVQLVGVRGMTEVNDTEYLVTVTGPTTFTIGADTSAFSTLSYPLTPLSKPFPAPSHREFRTAPTLCPRH